MKIYLLLYLSALWTVIFLITALYFGYTAGIILGFVAVILTIVRSKRAKRKKERRIKEIEKQELIDRRDHSDEMTDEELGETLYRSVCTAKGWEYLGDHK